MRKELTEAAQSQKGKELAEALGLKSVFFPGYEGDRYNLSSSYGSKSALGLYRVINSILKG